MYQNQVLGARGIELKCKKQGKRKKKKRKKRKISLCEEPRKKKNKMWCTASYRDVLFNYQRSNSVTFYNGKTQ